MRKNNVTKLKTTFNKNNNLLKDCIVNSDIIECVTKTKVLNLPLNKIEILVCEHNKKETVKVPPNIFEKVYGYGFDLTVLVLILVIPTIPFWDL